MRRTKFTFLTAACIIALSSICVAKRSTIDGGQHFALTGESSTDITLSTQETPDPDCPDDQPDGEPEYFWEFGPLDGEPGDGGEATIHADVEGSYQVKVHCEQQYKDHDGDPYTAQTDTSL